MKKIVSLLVIALITVFAIGRFNLGESGAMKFMAKMEALMNDGKADEICEMFADDLEIDIIDHSGDVTHRLNGGKKEMCDVTRQAIAGFELFPHSMEVNYSQVTASQSLLSPWRSNVTYAEHRRLTVPGAMTLRTVSNDQITLIQTLSGVKLRSVKSELFKEDAT